MPVETPGCIARLRFSGMTIAGTPTSYTTTLGPICGGNSAWKPLQILRGHRKANVTQIYAERDMTRAATVAAKIG